MAQKLRWPWFDRTSALQQSIRRRIMNVTSTSYSGLSIARVDTTRYQLTDTSVASIGLCLGVFSSLEAAELHAAKIARARINARSIEPATDSVFRSGILAFPS